MRASSVLVLGLPSANAKSESAHIRATIRKNLFFRGALRESKGEPLGSLSFALSLWNDKERASKTNLERVPQAQGESPATQNVNHFIAQATIEIKSNPPTPLDFCQKYDIIYS